MFITNFLQKIPTINTPKKFFASLNNAKLCLIILLALFIIVLLNGKCKCFSVLAAELQNKTCNSVMDTCGMATLNWIAFLSEMIIVGANPFITNMLMRVHVTGVLGGRITYQFALILVIGVLLTSFVSDPESLFVTDTIIQGSAIASLLAIVHFKITHTFPEESPHYRTVFLLSEIAPWCGVLLCPIYGGLITKFGWQSSYIFICLCLLIICVLAGIVDPGGKTETTKTGVNETTPHLYDTDSEDDDEIVEIGENNKMNDDNKDELKKKKEMTQRVRQSDYWDMEDTDELDEQQRQLTEAECRNPSLLQLLLNANNMSSTLTRPIVIIWFIERALAIVAEYNIIINIVHYMKSVLLESLTHASTIMVTLGVGYIMGYLIVYVLPTNRLKLYLLKIYALSTLILIASFIVWQIYGGGTERSILSNFTVPDAHFMIIVIGVFSAMTNTQMPVVAEDIIERPKIVSVSLTKLAQAIGLMFGPITSGMLIQINLFRSFFSIQAFIHALRIVLLAFIIYKKEKLNKIIV